MSGLEIVWPDAGGERVRAARGRLEQARAALQRMPLAERLAAVSHTLALWTAVDSPFRRELAEALGAATPFHPQTVAEGLESALRAWDPERFLACCHEELAPVVSEPAARRGQRAIAPFDWTAVLAGGTIPMPTLLSGLLPLVGGSPVLLRETSKDPVSGSLLKRSLARVHPDLARAFEPIAFPIEDEAALAPLLEAPCVVATGSDETISQIGRRLRPTQRFVAYGHRFSIAILGGGGVRDPEQLAVLATNLALDVARWDQSGCLSPAMVYLLDVAPEDRRRLATALADALERIARALPRGEVPMEARAMQVQQRDEARMRAASGRDLLVLDRASALVILEDEIRARPAPLHRFLRLLPAANLPELLRALEPFRGQLSSVALAGLDPEQSEALASTLAALGISRITRPGRLQTPPVDWPHDGLPLLLPMLRFLQREGPASRE